MRLDPQYPCKSLMWCLVVFEWGAAGTSTPSELAGQPAWPVTNLLFQWETVSKFTHNSDKRSLTSNSSLLLQWTSVYVHPCKYTQANTYIIQTHPLLQSILFYVQSITAEGTTFINFCYHASPYILFK